MFLWRGTIPPSRVTYPKLLRARLRSLHGAPQLRERLIARVRAVCNELHSYDPEMETFVRKTFIR